MARRAIASPSPTVSAGALPEIVHGWESLDRLLADDRFPWMAIEHWEEVALDKAEIHLDMDWPQYAEMERRGQFRVWTTRVDGALAGYIFWFIRPHMHYKSTPHALCDVFYLDPAFRQGLTGYFMFERCLAVIKQAAGVPTDKVMRIYLGDKLHMRGEGATIATLFARLGFRAVEVVHTKLL